MTKYLYIHIPFCRKFCPYCDFTKCIYQSAKANQYIDLVIKDLAKRYSKNKFKTIYLGGGTPNCLTNNQLDKLLSNLSKKLYKKYEFTIECNPEFVTEEQAKILIKNKINRVSLGVQTLDPTLLKTMNRLNHKFMVSNAISILRKNKIKNISCDLIYGFLNQTQASIKNDIDFLLANNVKHLSFYSLEIKENTLWYKTKYKTNEYEIEDHLKFIISYLDKMHFQRYEVSNWALNKKYQSQHNVAIWKTNDWAAIGFGAHGMEKNNLYYFNGSLLNWKKHNQKLSKPELYFQVLMMGLRLKEGLHLSNPLHKQAYKYFKKDIEKSGLIVRNNNDIIMCVNINLLDNFLVKLNYNEKN